MEIEKEAISDVPGIVLKADMDEKVRGLDGKSACWILNSHNVSLFSSDSDTYQILSFQNMSSGYFIFLFETKQYGKSQIVSADYLKNSKIFVRDASLKKKFRSTRSVTKTEKAK